MIPVNGQILIACPGKSLHCVYDGHLGVPIDPVWSPDGQQVAFVVKGDVYLVDIPGTRHTAAYIQSTFIQPLLHTDGVTEASVEVPEPRRLTFGGALSEVSCGLADFLAQEEMDRCSLSIHPSIHPFTYTLSTTHMM